MVPVICSIHPHDIADQISTSISDSDVVVVISKQLLG